MSNRRRVDNYAYTSCKEIPRLVRRDLPFSQSRNCLNVRLQDDAGKSVKKLRREDWFHVLLRVNTYVSMLGMVIAWTITICLFAGLYLAVDKAYSDSDCGLVGLDEGRDTLNYGAYFAFSLETATTVGYGLPGSTNAFFENCGGIQVLIYCQMVWSMMYNAFLFAFFFARLAKTESRGAQVIFSQTAILARNTEEGSGGPWMFEVRVTDVDAAHPVVEAHVRLYAKIGGQMVEMRVLSPNDVIGASLFLSWPTVIQHEVDVHSPLHPPQRQKDPFRLPNAGLNLRHAESIVGDVEQYACPVCGEPYGDMDRVRRHVEYYALVEENDKVPIVGSHRELNLDDMVEPPAASLDDIKAWFPDEVICIVEGIDPLASGTFQALQSWTVDEVSWEGNFEDCIKFTASETVVDLQKFHAITPEHDYLHHHNKLEALETARVNRKPGFATGQRMSYCRNRSMPLKDELMMQRSSYSPSAKSAASVASTTSGYDADILIHQLHDDTTTTKRDSAIHRIHDESKKTTLVTKSETSSPYV